MKQIVSYNDSPLSRSDQGLCGRDHLHSAQTTDTLMWTWAKQEEEGRHREMVLQSSNDSFKFNFHA
jgi:hypothetical protein